MIIVFPYCDRYNLLENTGDYKQAKKLYQQAVEIAETALGPEHPDTIEFREDLDRFFERDV